MVKLLWIPERKREYLQEPGDAPNGAVVMDGKRGVPVLVIRKDVDSVSGTDILYVESMSTGRRHWTALVDCYMLPREYADAPQLRRIYPADDAQWMDKWGFIRHTRENECWPI